MPFCASRGRCVVRVGVTGLNPGSARPHFARMLYSGSLRITDQSDEIQVWVTGAGSLGRLRLRRALRFDGAHRLGRGVRCRARTPALPNQGRPGLSHSLGRVALGRLGVGRSELGVEGQPGARVCGRWAGLGCARVSALHRLAGGGGGDDSGTAYSQAGCRGPQAARANTHANTAVRAIHPQA